MKNPAYSWSSIWIQGVVGSLWGRQGALGLSLVAWSLFVSSEGFVLLQNERAQAWLESEGPY